MGLVGAVKGEDRINWALLRIIDVLMFSATEKWLTTTESRRSLKEMSTSWNLCGLAAAITAMKSSLAC